LRRVNDIKKDSQEIETVESLTSVFESLASTQVAKVKNKVQMSQEFFNLLWEKYTSLRVDSDSWLMSRHKEDNGRDVYIMISAEAGLSGDIDLRLVETVLRDYDPKTTDIIVLGTHGAQQLLQRGAHYVGFYKVPLTDTYVDVSPIVESIRKYRHVKVYFEEYVSLGVQDIKTIDLIQQIQAMTKGAEDSSQVMSTSETIFEPSLDEIADIMEDAMMSLALSQAILESGLAQDASRFNAMAAAKKRAMELVGFYKLEYHRSVRADNDRRMREVMISLKRKERMRVNA
jgi:ATP synthase F1 gamma subunit